jgi:hypothetical protein
MSSGMEKCPHCSRMFKRNGGGITNHKKACIERQQRALETEAIRQSAFQGHQGETNCLLSSLLSVLTQLYQRTFAELMRRRRTHGFLKLGHLSQYLVRSPSLALSQPDTAKTPQTWTLWTLNQRSRWKCHKKPQMKLNWRRQRIWRSLPILWVVSSLVLSNALIYFISPSASSRIQISHQDTLPSSPRNATKRS